MGQKSTIKLVKKVLLDENKRKQYSPEEILYMEKELDQMILDKARKKYHRQTRRGFGY